MIDKTKASDIVNSHFFKSQTDSDDFAIERTIEYPGFWFFNYNSAKYLRSKNISYALAGNLPLIVDKNGGNIYQLLISGETRFSFEEITLMSTQKLIYFDLIKKVE